jgi:hypothetical protein
MSRRETAPSPPSARRPTIDAVVTHHLDGYRSGVARFNEVLAERLGVPMLGLGEVHPGACSHPLLSFKVSELGDAAPLVEEALTGTWDAFLHEYRGLELERRIVGGATRVLCGNGEILDAVRGLAAEAEALWAPGLVFDDRPFAAADVTVFSFGMAHKIRVDMFQRLKELLEASGSSYAVYVSAANHETASLRDSAAIFAAMHELFPRELYFLGNLSDVAVANQLASATYFAAFFERGVRANNSSVAAAMQLGAVVITNLDVYSPPWLAHLENVIDIGRCDELPRDPLILRRIAVCAMETAREHGWHQLVERIR